MKGSAKAGVVIAALTPDSYRDNAEERLLKGCASVAEIKNCINRFARHCLPAGRQGQGSSSI
uniref:hypothetical protein n=1 Tax=Daejeonella sp. TaxID=2805397 RepID=UPI0040493E84